MGSKVGSGEVEAEPECLGGHGSTLSLLKPYRFPIDYDPVIQFRQSAIQSAGPRVGKVGRLIRCRKKGEFDNSCHFFAYCP